VATLSHVTKPHEKEKPMTRRRPKVRATGARRAERNAEAEPQQEPEQKSEQKSESKKESGDKKGKS
jgi:hypothetical protein